MPEILDFFPKNISQMLIQYINSSNIQNLEEIRIRNRKTNNLKIFRYRNNYFSQNKSEKKYLELCRLYVTIQYMHIKIKSAKDL